MTEKPWRDTTADILFVITHTQIDRKSTADAATTAGGQFSFRRSPPSATPASQHTDECRHKEALREEIRKQLKLLVDISGTDNSFISRSQQQQQNDVLPQWKKWLWWLLIQSDKTVRVFVGPTLLGSSLRTL
jgi:hypothetical protein